MNEPKTKLEYVIQFTDKTIPEIMQREGVDEKEAKQMYLDAIFFSYMKQENEVDVLDLAIVCALLGLQWPDIANVKIFHDIYHSPYYKECEEDVLGFSDGICPQLLLPVGLAEKYLDYLYKKAGKGIDEILWRCLCIGCLPNAAFLRLRDEQKRETFTDDIGWVIFENLFAMDEEQIDMAINLKDYKFEIYDEDPNGTSEA